MGSRTQEGLRQGEYQPKMRGVEGIIMSWNQGANKGGGKSNLCTRAEGASDTKIRIISSGPPQERGQSVRCGNQDPEFRASSGERSDEKDAEASAFLCGKSVVWENLENPDSSSFYLQEPGVHTWVKDPHQLQEVLVGAVLHGPFFPVIRGPRESQARPANTGLRATCLSVGAQTGTSGIQSLTRSALLNSPQVEVRRKLPGVWGG